MVVYFRFDWSKSQIENGIIWQGQQIKKSLIGRLWVGRFIQYLAGSPFGVPSFVVLLSEDFVPICLRMPESIRL